jgi:hypothetical protein
MQCGGEARWPAEGTEGSVEEAQGARDTRWSPEASRKAASGAADGGRQIGLKRVERPPSDMTGRTHAPV